MPRYFFHVGGSSRDTEGVHLESLAVAKCEAVKLAGQLICESAGVFWDAQDFVMNVANEDGLTLFNLMFIGTEAAAISAPRAHVPAVGERPS